MIARTDSSSPAGLSIYRLHQLLKPHAFKHLHTEQQTNLKTDNNYRLRSFLEPDLEKDTLQLPDRNVVDGAGAELAVEFLGSDGSELVDVAGPEVEDVVPGVPVPLLDHHHLGPQELGLDGGPEAAGAGPDHEDPGPLTRLASVVTLVARLLVQLGPQRLRLPCLEVSFQFGIEEWKLVRF